MDYAEILRSRLRTPEERLRDARLAGSVVGRPQESAWQPEYQQEPGLEASNPEDWVPGPGTLKAMALKAAAAAKGLGGLAMAGGVGIIRKGGREDLVAIHQTSPQRLWPWTQNDKLPRELYAPSVAINRDKISQNFGNDSGTVTLVARPDVLDPKNVGGKLWVRDAYTPRMEQFSGKPAENAVKDARDIAHDTRLDLQGDSPEYASYPSPEAAMTDTLRYHARNRNWDRFNSGGFNDMRTMEGVAPDQHHTAQILRSQEFPSYAGFERSPHGADRLVGYNPADQNEEKAWIAWHELSNIIGPDAMQDLYRRQGGHARNILQGIHEMNAGGLLPPEATRALYNYERIVSSPPSQYAEHKITAPVGLHGGNWAGAIITPPDAELMKAAAAAKEFPTPFNSHLSRITTYSSDDAVKKLLENFTSRGIPAVVQPDYNNVFDVAKYLSEKAK